MALFCARMASVHANLSAKAAWAVAKEANVTAKVQTKVIMVRKSRVEIGIVTISVVNVLGPADSTGIGGIRGSNDVGNGLVAVGAVDAGMWGSSVRAAGGGWSSVGSLSRRGGALGANCHFSTVKIASQTRRCSKWG